jgi:orotidine-5'-phosphate decarboxylase
LSRLIFSLDEVVDKEVLVSFSPRVAYVKVGWPFILKAGMEGVRDASRVFEGRLIFDLKLADIASTMSKVVSSLTPYGEGFIAHAFVGYEEALDEVKELLEREGRKLFLVTSMSHRGWNDSFYPYLREVIHKASPFGLVAPATRLEVLKRIRQDFPDKVIVSPGVGAQGARPGDALCAGADYEIVGRSIYASPDPLKSLLEVERAQGERLNECKGAEDRQQ